MATLPHCLALSTWPNMRTESTIVKNLRVVVMVVSTSESNVRMV